MSQELRFDVLEKTRAKQRVQLCCCCKVAPSHTAHLSFCLKLARFVKKLKRVQNTVRISPVAGNSGQNSLRNCRCA